jgi:hypothetical protein
MKREEILNTFRQLAQGQGFYGRLLNSLEEANEESRESFLKELEGQNFKDPVDLVLYIEK